MSFFATDRVAVDGFFVLLLIKYSIQHIRRGGFLVGHGGGLSLLMEEAGVLRGEWYGRERACELGLCFWQ